MPAEENLLVHLPNGQSVFVAATPLGGDEHVSLAKLNLENLNATIVGIAESLHTVVEKMGPSKFEVKFGLEIAVESGHLTALLVQGKAKANLDITLTWEK